MSEAKTIRLSASSCIVLCMKGLSALRSGSFGKDHIGRGKGTCRALRDPLKRTLVEEKAGKVRAGSESPGCEPSGSDEEAYQVRTAGHCLNSPALLENLQPAGGLDLVVQT